MKKSRLCIVLACVMLMSGCSVGKVFYPNVPKAELYYNTVDFINSADIKGGRYDDLFLAPFVSPGITQEALMQQEKRQVWGQTLNYVDYYPKTEGDNALDEWMKESIFQYGFSGTSEQTNSFIYYLIQNTELNTYDDYLNVMRALTLKYGECTTEVYKKEGYSINNTSVGEGTGNTDKLIKKYNEAYENGEIAIESRWVNSLFTIRVLFSEDRSARITYEYVD